MNFDNVISKDETEKCLEFWRSVVEKQLEPVKCTPIENALKNKEAEKKRESTSSSKKPKRSVQSKLKDEDEKPVISTTKIESWNAILLELQKKRLHRTKLMLEKRCRFCGYLSSPPYQASSPQAEIKESIKELDSWQPTSRKKSIGSSKRATSERRLSKELQKNRNSSGSSNSKPETILEETMLAQQLEMEKHSLEIKEDFQKIKMKFVAIVAIALVAGAQAGTYTDRFLEQYNKIKNSNNGYFSKDNVPYHSVETLIVEAPDHGHETTSEAYSYWVWLEAMYGAIQGDFSNFNTAWNVLEQYAIPKLQNSNSYYNPSSPATYAPELDDPSQYPSAIDSSVKVGVDPLANELKNAYGSDEMYSMHWLFDVDNVYGFGNVQGQCESGPYASGPSFYNNYQRGPMESVWRTIPQPTCDNYKYGGTNGFLDLFVKDNSYSPQYKYTAAPDADARAVQAAYWANVWATAKGQQSSVSSTLSKAAKMGDYLRYSLFDKYFKKIGNCYDAYSCQAGTGKDSAHYLINWYFAWGGSYNAQYGWSWRIGDGASHFGYQNPLAAYALANDASLKPKSPTASDDWSTSLTRQLELYEYLQTSEGAFAGGVTNSWKGRYAQPDSDLLENTFYGMFYDWEPVYHDPPSNRWFGMQAWSADRLAQYYYVTGDSKAQSLLSKWVAWVTKETTFSGNTFQMPSTLGWTGNPPNVHVSITSYGIDLGCAASTARTLAYYAAKSGDSSAKELAKKLLDAIYVYKDDLGFGVEEPRDDYTRFNEKVYVPSGWTGKYPNGDVIDSSATFIGIRSWYKNDPNWSKVEAYLNGGAVPTFTYHRFWTQTDIALAFGAYGLLFNE